MKTQREVNSKVLIMRKNFRESIMVNRLKITTTWRYLRGSIMKQNIKASISKQCLRIQALLDECKYTCMRSQGSNSEEEEDSVEDNRRHEKSSDCTNNVDIPGSYCRMHVEEFLKQISQVDNLFDHMEIPREKQVKLVVYKFKGAASTWWQNIQD